MLESGKQKNNFFSLDPQTDIVVNDKAVVIQHLHNIYIIKPLQNLDYYTIILTIVAQ